MFDIEMFSIDNIFFNFLDYIEILECYSFGLLMLNIDIKCL